MAHNTARIRALNDQFRTTLTGGKVYMTASVNALPPLVAARALEMTRTFDAFTADNDPYGQHDFGSFTLARQKFFWKIDYYNVAMDGGSENPADPAQSNRVLTLMLAEDY